MRSCGGLNDYQNGTVAGVSRHTLQMFWLSGVLVSLAWGAGSFGSNYPWAYTPLLIASAGLGLTGLWLGRRSPGPSALLTLRLACIALAVVAQLVPLPTRTPISSLVVSF